MKGKQKHSPILQATTEATVAALHPDTQRKKSMNILLLLVISTGAGTVENCSSYNKKKRMKKNLIVTFLIVKADALKTQQIVIYYCFITWDKNKNKNKHCESCVVSPSLIRFSYLLSISFLSLLHSPRWQDRRRVRVREALGTLPGVLVLRVQFLRGDSPLQWMGTLRCTLLPKVRNPTDKDRLDEDQARLKDR